MWDHRNPKRKKKRNLSRLSTKYKKFTSLFFWNKLGFLQDMASVRPSSATQEGFLLLLNEYKALVCYICLSRSRQSPITTRGKIHHLIGSGGGVLNPHAVLSICVIGQAIFAYIEYASKSFFLQLNCAIRKIVASIIIAFHPLNGLLFCHCFSQSMKNGALMTPQQKPFVSLTSFKNYNRNMAFSYCSWIWALILECGSHTYCTNEKLLLTSHLFIKEGCFVCFVCHIEISQSMLSPPPRSWCDLKSPRLVGVHWGSFFMFPFMVHEVLNVEQYYQWNFKKIKIENWKF